MSVPPKEALVISEWSARAVSHLHDLLSLTEALAGASIQNAMLRERAIAPSEDQRVAIEASDLHSEKLLRQIEVLHEEARGHFESIARLEDEVANRDERLRELSEDWEAQGAQIIELETRLDRFPLKCPECAAAIAPEAPESDVVSFARNKERLKPAIECGTCKTPFVPDFRNRKYCSPECSPHIQSRRAMKARRASQ